MLPDLLRILERSGDLLVELWFNVSNASTTNSSDSDQAAAENNRVELSELRQLMAQAWQVCFRVVAAIMNTQGRCR